jgi:plastocyanin
MLPILPLLSMLLFAPQAGAQPEPQTPAGPRPARVEITPSPIEAEVGDSVKFTAVGYDDEGRRMELRPTAWFGSPFDVAAADENGIATFFLPGQARIGATIGGRPGFATVTVRPQRVARIELGPVTSPIAVGAGIRLEAFAKTANGDPRSDVEIEWTSAAPRVAAIDAAGLVTGVTPGRARLTARSGSAAGTIEVTVIANPVKALAVTPRTTKARTGDVVRFAATATGTSSPAIRWSVSGEGAAIESDGAFVAERPGSYVITASSGDKNAAASIVVSPRNVSRELELVGRTPLEEFQTAEQWIIGNYLYAGSMSGRVWVYDISNPAAPVKTDSVAFDARLINDVSTTGDGKTMVVTREGASNRKNGIVFLDASEPAHPKVISEYTATVTGGVHSAFVDGHHVFLTDDATGSLRVIDFADVKNPKEVARWEVEKELARPIKGPEGETIGGRYLHDIYAKDGLLYLGYWRDGLIILDIGAGIKGGSPANPKLVSQLRFNYLDMYGPGWVAGAHSVYRHKNYVFLGDEVFPAQFNIQSRDRIPVQGIVHVVDVSDVERPRKVAEYDVPESGAHNMWVTEDDVMVMGYYNGGGRVVDVSGELRGNLYRQGREIARLWTGDPKGWRPNLPFTWGAQPHQGLIYFNDINSGIWITRLPPAKPR